MPQRELLEKSEISLLLDTYDDIFSDFDPRSYTKRALSGDFLEAAQHATRETKEGALELHLLLPRKQREKREEVVIKQRLNQHFRKHAFQLEHQIKHTLHQGILITLLGFLFMLIAGLVIFRNPDSFKTQFLRILLEPSGWFMVWFGLDKIFYGTREVKTNLDFYKKMVKAELVFDTY
ncbi:hypothetical protein J4457_02885 [Candidatus Woesearchaeota archaeon]|nr:hypothetical protein [Candidatus Woesearchaeota archaeon]